MSTATLVKRAPRAARTSRKATLTAVDSVIDSKPKKIADLIKGPHVKIGKRKVEFRLQKGGDPELFLVDLQQDGKLVSAIPILKHDKHDPIDLGDGIRFYSDGVGAEVAFPPSDTNDEMIERLRTAFTRMHEYVGSRYAFVAKAAHWFDDAELAPTEWGDPSAIGCSVSFSALTASVISSTSWPDNHRTGSCHIHLGNRDFQGDHGGHLLTFDGRHDAIKLFNVYVALASVVFSRDESSKTRRITYGLPYEMRPTVYGCEARTLDPYPLRSPELMRLVLDLTDHAMNQIKNGTERDVLGAVDLDAVGAAITQCDKEAAWDIVADLDLPTDMLTRIKKDYGQPDLKASWGL